MAKPYMLSILNEEQKKKYISRSEVAINGINVLDNSVILNTGKHIVSKIITFARSMGCKNEGKSCYNYYIPSKVNDIYFQIRLSEHFNEKKENYLKWETLGVPNKRILIYFDNKCKHPDIQNYTEEYQGTNVKVTLVALPIYFLDIDENITIFKLSLIRLFQTGVFELPSDNPTDSENRKGNTEVEPCQGNVHGNQSRKSSCGSGNQSVNDCLQRQYEMMNKLGCMSRELYERLIHES